jgi:lipopolysaccharide transport system ATP-binding protein
MSATVIRANEIGKSYRLTHQKWDRNRTLRDELTSAVTNLFKRADPAERAGKTETFWALQDVSFDIRKGESVGFIGHNGAGKSTLLKLISRITDPTSGGLEITGRVASLLEVGTGFHAELTGRENIYLKGAIMGVKHSEVRRAFDEIVAFAEMERFLDTPVKRYSSGMYVKLGFSVAAHLCSDILIVDEVLAVGDAHFRRKCIDKMHQIMAQDGRTILFVSHNMALIRSVCTRVMALEKGRVIDDGGTSEVINRYSARMEERAVQNLADRQDRAGRGEIRVVEVEAYSPTPDGSKTPLTTGQPARFVMRLNRMLPGTSCIAFIFDKSESAVSYFDSHVATSEDNYQGELADTIVCDVESLPLVHGSYHLELHIWQQGKQQDLIQRALAFEVERGGFGGRGVPPDHAAPVLMEHRWTFPMK